MDDGVVEFSCECFDHVCFSAPRGAVEEEEVMAFDVVVFGLCWVLVLLDECFELGFLLCFADDVFKGRVVLVPDVAAVEL